MAFDLSTLNTVQAADAGSVLEIRHPVTGDKLSNGTGESVTFILAGRDSERAKQAERAALNRRLKASARRTHTVSAEDIDADALEILAQCTLGWSGFILDGQQIDCTPANARRLYEQYPWVREQAQAWVEDRANFFPVSPAS